ncbi:NACHT domain-containing protein [Pedobacter nyackensis]|uniref:NACHT domain-containing protein n=1 Tax=Pedobacter nyackensis TaxID=475255 RepID=A0A1W2C6K9_9SPHI|nr:NACHT domain-containing protein [Pedobacter nyackensis]SMC80654.1 NACHT domain-containing protein [Pedobacter nyackensis]
MDETAILNELKRLILIKTGIRTITPSDCKRISIEISRSLNKNVSETTIKRLFGFAEAKHNFSNFTITTLSEYVNGENPENWPVHAHVSNKHIIPANWSDVKFKISKVTDFTLKGIKNRSSMPYQMTISRKFAEHDFDVFYKSDFSFTAFISQPGYGKTILLSHLAERLISNVSAYKDSTVLFVQASNFFNSENVALNFEDQLKSLLNISKKESLVNYISENCKQSNGKFIIFLDGFSELAHKNDLKKQLFDGIISFICSIEHVKAIKLVMSMRSTAWIRFYEKIRHSAYLKSKWFMGNYFNQNEVSNVPPLTEKEVDLIISKIDGINIREINPKLKNQLKFPFHIELYHQLREEDPLFNYSTNITFHELISRFIQENIYRSNYYTEKILFLKRIIQLTSYGKTGNAVPKDSLINELSAFKNAYMELVSDGIIMEEKHYQDYHPREFVRFIHTHIFEYFLFIELLEKFHLQLDTHFFQHIHEEYHNNNTRFQLLQWTVRFIVRIGDLKALLRLFDLQFDHLEHNYLILFIAENLKYRSKYSADTINLLREYKLHDRIIEELIHFDFVDSNYKEAIEVLADLSDSEEHTLIYQSLLAMIDILSMNEERIKMRLEKLNDLNATGWLIDPREATQLIYAKITNAPIVDNPLISCIQRSEYPFLDHNRELNTQQGITYLLVIVLNLLYGSDNSSVKIIDTIINLHPKDFSKRSEFSIFILNLMGLSKSRMNSSKKTDQLERILIRLHETRDRYKTTQYSALILKMTRAYQHRNKGEYEKACEYCDECIHLFKKYKLNLNGIMMYNLIIAIYSRMNNIPKVNEYKYERLCMMDENNISSGMFFSPRASFIKRR